MGDTGSAMTLGTLWPGLQPDQQQQALVQALRLGTLNKKSDIVGEQIQQAMGQQKGSGKTGYGVLGGLGVGLNDAADAILGALREKSLRGQQDSLLSAIEQGRVGYGNALFGAPAVPSSPFGNPNANMTPKGGY